MDYTVNGIDVLALSNRLEQQTGFYLQTAGCDWQIRNPLGNLVIQWGSGTVWQLIAGVWCPEPGIPQRQVVEGEL